MLRKILLSVTMIFIFSFGAAAAAEKIHEIPDMNCTVTIPDNYVVNTVERKAAPDDELGVKEAQLTITDPVDKTFAIHIMVESSKLTKELPDLDYKPGEVMKNYFTEMLQNSGWQEPAVLGSLESGQVHFIKFSSYIADSAGQKYDGEIYATAKNGQLLYLMLMSKERALKPEERIVLAKMAGSLQFAQAAEQETAEISQ